MPTKTKIKQVALVTGCAGALGAEICKQLLAKRFIVMGLDNLSGNDGKLMPDHKNFTFINNDIRDASLFTLMRGADFVFHLADTNNPNDEILTTHSVNVTGTLNVLEYTRRHNAKLLFKHQVRDPFKNNMYYRQKKICISYLQAYYDLGVPVAVLSGDSAKEWMYRMHDLQEVIL